MTKIGIVGIGFMGMIHYYAIQRITGAEVVAICTRRPEETRWRLDRHSREFWTPRRHGRSLKCPKI